MQGDLPRGRSLSHTQVASTVLTRQRLSRVRDSTRLVRRASLGEASVNTKMSERGGVCSRASWPGKKKRLMFKMVAAEEWVEPGKAERKGARPWKEAGGTEDGGGDDKGAGAALAPPGGGAWKVRIRGKGRGRRGTRVSDLQGRQAHLRLISTP